MAYILISGNPVDGYTFIGPFEYEAAIRYAEIHLDGDWWIGKLLTVDDADISNPPEEVTWKPV